MLTTKSTAMSGVTPCICLLKSVSLNGNAASPQKHSMALVSAQRLVDNENKCNRSSKVWQCAHV